MMMHENTYSGGRLQRIATLIHNGSHHVEAWGNTREGFEAYLVYADRSSGVSISSHYKRLCDLRADARDQYGPLITVRIGRNWL